MNYIPFIRYVTLLPSAWTRLWFHESQSRFHVILNIPGNSIADSDDGMESRGKCEEKRREREKGKWISICRVRIRVTVANKFELSCTIDRSFHPEPPGACPLFSNLLKFYAVPRWERSDSKVLLTPGRTLHYEGERGSFSRFRCTEFIPFCHVPKRKRFGDVSVSIGDEKNLSGMLSDARRWLRNTCFVARRALSVVGLRILKVITLHYYFSSCRDVRWPREFSHFHVLATHNNAKRCVR